MKTSLNETKAIEDYLLGYSTPPDSLLFQAQMILNPGLHQNVLHQQAVYEVVEQYGRKNLKLEIEAVYQKLIAEPEHQGFIKRIQKLFKN